MVEKESSKKEVGKPGPAAKENSAKSTGAKHTTNKAIDEKTKTQKSSIDDPAATKKLIADFSMGRSTTSPSVKPAAASTSAKPAKPTDDKKHSPAGSGHSIKGFSKGLDVVARKHTTPEREVAIEKPETSVKKSKGHRETSLKKSHETSVRKSHETSVGKSHETSVKKSKEHRETSIKKLAHKTFVAKPHHHRSIGKVHTLMGIHDKKKSRSPSPTPPRHLQRPTISSVGRKSVDPDAATQLRSTLALGQLITAKTPTAGSRMIAHELRSLNTTIKTEGAALRKDLATLPNRLADVLKVVMDDEREHRNQTSMMNRRPVQFGQYPYRRFPVYRRGGPRRVSLPYGARKAIADAATSTSPSSASKAATTAATAPVDLTTAKSPTIKETHQHQPTASKEVTAAKAAWPTTKAPAGAVGWVPPLAAYKSFHTSESSSQDGEHDSDSSPHSTP